MNDLLLDIRHALRVLLRSPVFTAVTLVTLSLGIAANVVVFGVLNAVLLRPLDITDPGNLYQLRLKPWTSFKLLTTSFPAFRDYEHRNTSFSEIAGFYGYCDARLSWDNSVQRAHGEAVTDNYFEMLGVKPEMGRLIQAGDDRGPGSAPYIVLSDKLWRSAFDADPGVIGKSVRLAKDPFTVVGVAPGSFHGTEQFYWPDYFIPVVNYFKSGYLQDRKGRPLTVLGRLKPGLSPQQAAENLSAIASELAKEYPETDTGEPLKLVRPGLFADDGDVIRGFIYSVTGLALLVLVAACANLATLFAARAADRSREMGIRVALGSSRWRLIRQLMTEALILATLGGAAGLIVADLLFGVLNRWQSPYGHLAVSVDGRVYIVALVLTLASALLLGMVPAKQVWKCSPLRVMKSGAVDGAHWRRLSMRDLLLGAQIAICMLLVTASLVAVRGMTRMFDVRLGFQPRGAILAEADFSLVKGDNVSLEKKKAMLEAVRSISGVSAAGILSKSPFSGGIREIPVFPAGTTELTLDHSVLAAYNFTISPGYLQAAKTNLRSGRDFSWRDRVGTPLVAIVNQTFARRMWGQAPAIERFFIFRNRLREVVGVVEDGKYHQITESPRPAVYLPLSQNKEIWPIFVIRSDRAPSEIAPTIERALKNIEPGTEVTVQSWPEAMAGALFPTQAATVALGTMGLLAAMLAVTGIFGMAAYNVSRRMKELGIRVALGARKKHLINAAVGRPIILLLLGSSGGLLCGMVASRLLGQIVYQADPRDPLVVLGAVLTMALLGLTASALPALRALAVNPCQLLREE